MQSATFIMPFGPDSDYNNLLQDSRWKTLLISNCTRQVSSMIHSAKPTVPPVAIILICSLFCFVLRDFEKSGRTTCVKTMMTTGRDCGSAEWINKLYGFFFHPVVGTQVVLKLNFLFLFGLNFQIICKFESGRNVRLNVVSLRQRGDLPNLTPKKSWQYFLPVFVGKAIKTFSSTKLQRYFWINPFFRYHFWLLFSSRRFSGPVLVVTKLLFCLLNMSCW